MAKKPLIRHPGDGRHYDMGPMTARFLADGPETGNGYAISEWWLEPHTKGPGIHKHDDDDVFFVLGGVMSIFVDGQWHEVTKGGFALAPGGVEHDFENRSDARAGVLNLSFPGGFEQNMPSIVAWFKQNPLGRA